MKTKKYLLVFATLLMSCKNNNPVISSSYSTNSSSTSSSSLSSDSSTISTSSSIQEYEYFVTFNDEEGNLLDKIKYKEGEIPFYEYNKEDTEEWDYKMLGWSESLNGEIIDPLPAVTKNTTYFAVVSKTLQTYTITFESNGGSIIEDITKEYGTLINAPEKPIYQGYKFVSWCYDKTLVNPVEWPISLTNNLTLYAKWNETVNIKKYLESLLNSYELNPFLYIPETMQPSYAKNVIEQDSIIENYDEFIKISSINSNGFGEQWQMVLDNLNQSMTFFSVLSVVDDLVSTSIVTFNNYFDKNPDDTAFYNFKEGIYSITINFDGKILSYVIDYTGNIPIFGEQKIQIALSMNIEESTKCGRIQIGDSNALIYNIGNNYYDFAIKYLNVRTAYFSIEKKQDNSVIGHIYENLIVSNIKNTSAADFYINDNYVSVVGNKASGIIGFTGYINELYNFETGKLLGYEVRETLSAITYNTLWFDLNYFSNINSIRSIYDEETEKTYFYINNSSEKWETKKVGGFNLKSQSRRFDIEFRTQSFYYYDTENENYVEAKCNVPMLFVQEENFDTLVEDIKEVNNIEIVINLNKTHINKILEDYDSLIDVFIENKELITEDKIVEIIGEAYTY